MAITIKKVTCKADLKRFTRFNYELYKDCEYACPELDMDIYDTFNPKSNPSYEFCEADLFLAYRDDKVVGRIACIVNHRANKRWQCNNARFGWIDFIDDYEVSAALIETAERWGREHKCDTLVGPLGFTDMDPEGMLIEGFDQLTTMSTIYNFPYYKTHLERLGYDKEVDWVERKIMVPKENKTGSQERYFRVAELVKKRFGLRVRKFKSIKELKAGGYQYKIFEVVNKAYANLYGYSEMSRKQMDKYADQYLTFLDLRLLTLLETPEGEIIGMGVGMGSLTEALRKAKGKLFPFGWYHLLKAIKFKHSHIIDLLLVGVLPEWQHKGANALFFADIIPIAQQMGFEFAESHPQLEDNNASQDQWSSLDCTIHKRRRCFKRVLD